VSSIEAWRLIVEPSCPGVYNMAVDEALGRSAAETGRSTLRVYSFGPPAVTVGRFQNLDGFLDTSACRGEGVDIVRRPTGGLAILHKDDFTYSVAFPRGGGGASSKDENFSKIARGILNALRLLGIEAGVASHEDEEAGGGWCFSREYGVDIVWRSRKICGSAQRVYDGSLLQHGSLFLKDSSELLERLCPGEGAVRAGQAPVTVAEACSRGVTWDELAGAFVEGFAEELGILLENGSTTAEERRLAEKLSRERYAAGEWLTAGA
jgi:lipoate-protein ligase A